MPAYPYGVQPVYAWPEPVATPAPDPALRTFHAALANRAYAPVKIVALGASTVDGVGVTAWGRALLDRLAVNLRVTYPISGVTGGAGFIPAQPTTPAIPGYPVTPGGGTSYATTTPGWANRSLQLTATGNSLTFTFTGTSVGIAYGQYTGGGTANVVIDAAAPIALVTNGATTDRFRMWNSGGLTRGAHTVTLTWVSGPVYIRGFFAFDQDENSGIHIYNGGRAGWTSTDYAAPAAQLQWSFGITQAQPHLVLIDLGRNDYTSAPQVGSATVRANLLTIIGVVRANCTTNPSIVLYETQRIGGPINGEQWPQYRAMYESVAAADPMVTCFDLGLRHLPPQDDNTLGLYNTDITHLTDRGHQNVADYLAAFLAPR
jgi:lysophospholipase L1-like esterase